MKAEVKKFKASDFVLESKKPIKCSFDDITPELMNTLLKYAPFGQENPAPLFQTKCDVDIMNELKGGLHYKCVLSSAKTEVVGLFFNVEKEEFLQRLSEREQEFTFLPGLAYNAKDNSFSIELKCELV